MLFEGEHIEYLNKDIGVIVSPTHTFGTDALLLASFAAPRRTDAAIDLGTGCGIVPFYWLREDCENLAALELQEQAFHQLERSVKLNRAEEQLKIYHADLREFKGILPFGTFDLVTMNPPYKPEGTGILSTEGSDKIARHGTVCTLEDVSLAASRLLRFGGRLAICLRPERLCDAVKAMQRHNIEPKRLRFVAQRPDKAPWLLLLEGRLGGKSGLQALPELYIEGEHEGYSEEMRKIIGTYYDGKGGRA
ncbi:MAG: methyltransferase [Oscillospiraceae bacterium]|nr:methyltransferase [Oscillospiraceae bacterium]